MALVMASLWGAGVAAAETATCPPSAPLPGRELMLRAQTQAADRGLLWRVSRDGRDSFVYGSMHAGRPEWMALGPQTERALARTGVLALEVDVMDPAVQAALGAVTDGPPRRLPDDVAQALRAAWQAECLPPQDLQTGATEFRAMQLAVAQAQREGLFTLYGAEAALLMRNLRAQRPVVGLETVQTQLDTLLARDADEAAAMVRDVLADWRHPRAGLLLQRLARAWAQGDLSDLEAYADWCECMDQASQRQAFERQVMGRNPGMVQAFERLHANVSVFAAVGALHVIGPHGLPALLRARGFAVSRVF